MKKIFNGRDFTAVFTDENGYFSFTGEVDGSSGAVGERIVEIEPKFAGLENLHLCDATTGEPMHAFANAKHFLEKNADILAKKQLHVSEELFKNFAHAWRKHEELKRNAEDDEQKAEAAEALAELVDEIRDEWAAAVEMLDDVFDELEEYLPENRPEFVEPVDANGDVLEAYVDEPDDELERKTALGRFLNVNISEIFGVTYDDTVFEVEGKSWMVVTDEEADDLWDKDLDNYIDECLEIPAHLENYFDRDAWKRDARVDGRGHSLGRYDGEEHFSKGVKQDFYIYRQ